MNTMPFVAAQGFARTAPFNFSFFVAVPGHRVTKLESLDAPVAVDDDGGQLCLGDVLAHRQDDPSYRAVRELDWTEFMAELSPPQQHVLWATSVGFGTKEQAGQLNVSAPRIVQHKRAAAKRAVAFWGDTVLRDAAEKPLWTKQRQYR